ncbi:MAG: DUF1592 domain-containing protein [Pirellulaceae bacterium]
MSHWRCIRLLSVAAVMAVALVARAEEDRAEEDRTQVFQQKVRPLLVKYCFECHNDDLEEAELNLRPFNSLAQVLDDHKRWVKLLQKVQFHEMPPPDAAQPTKAERQQITAWVDDAVNNINCTGEIDPGRPTIRRLNRVEYRNTIRDLLGVDYAPADDFPADDVGYGFDNIGDVLSLPPILLEKYLAAAEDVTGEVILTDLKSPLDVQIAAAELEATRGSSRRGLRGRILTSSGEMYFAHDFPHRGKYHVTTVAWGDQAGDEPVRMSLRVDGRQVHVFEVKAERGAPQSYSHILELAPGKHRIGLAFLNDYYEPDAKDPGQRDRNLIVEQVSLDGPEGFRPADLPETHTRIFFVSPGDDLPKREAARKILERFASRAYRRPARESEVVRLLRLFDLADENGESFERAIQLCVQAVLVSPHFLYKVEQPGDPEKDGETRLLSEYELASNLSYFLWSSMPDNELLYLAHNGKLREGDNLERQVRRMLADPKAGAFVENFALQWLELRNLDSVTPDEQQFPQFDDNLRSAMLRETELFFTFMLREDRSVLDLLAADFTFVNEPLAKLYGIDGVEGDAFQRVSLSGTQRGGLLTQASVLTVTSNPTRTSPVKRGKWVLENLLGEPPPPPAPDAAPLDDQTQLTGTLRQRLEQHRADPRCATCHQKMDPLGFALENFDAIGGWRTRDEGQPIDASGELPSGETFNGAKQLQTLLLKTKKEQFVRCLTEKMLTYALGRGLEYYDQCAVNEIRAALADDNYRISTLVAGIARSEPFQRRRTIRR